MEVKLSGKAKRGDPGDVALGLRAAAYDSEGQTAFGNAKGQGKSATPISPASPHT